MSFYYNLSVEPVYSTNVYQNNCSIAISDYLELTANNLNTYSIVLFIVYSLCLFVTQYALEKEKISNKSYVKLHQFINNTFVAVAIVFLIYYIALL